MTYYRIIMLNDIILLFALFFGLERIGDIWSFQVVLFPLWSKVGKNEWVEYQAEHFRRLWGVIFLPMGLQALGAILLCIFPPRGVPLFMPFIGVGLQIILFLSLIYWIPFQVRLSKEGNKPELIRQLVRVHWTRVANITAYGLLVLWMLWLRLHVH